MHLGQPSEILSPQTAASALMRQRREYRAFNPKIASNKDPTTALVLVDGACWSLLSPVLAIQRVSSGTGKDERGCHRDAATNQHVQHYDHPARVQERCGPGAQ